MNKQRITIQQWASEDRPREKCKEHGSSHLSDSELLALLFRSGSRLHSAVDLAQWVLHQSNNDLKKISLLGVADLCLFPGIGDAKAAGVVAAFELGRRASRQQFEPKIPIRGSKDAFHLFEQKLQNKPHEEFWVAYLNKAHRVLQAERVGQGGWTSTLADVRVVYELALRLKATAVIVAHNHPSGVVQPSEADKDLTKRLVKAGDFLEIKLLDHIIVGQQDYFSFADQGLLGFS